MNIKINIASLNTNPSPVAEFSSMVLGEEIISEQDLTEFYEPHNYFNALSSTDDTFTGNLSYSWSLNSPDLDLIGSELSEVSFVAPEYIGQDKNYSLTLTVSDGTLESSVETDLPHKNANNWSS